MCSVLKHIIVLASCVKLTTEGVAAPVVELTVSPVWMGTRIPLCEPQFVGDCSVGLMEYALYVYREARCSHQDEFDAGSSKHRCGGWTSNE